MLSENALNALPEAISQRLEAVNTAYLESIGRRINEIGQLRPTDINRIQMIYQYGGDVDKIVQQLAAATAKNVVEINDIFNLVAKENYSYSKPFYEAQGLPYLPFKDNKQLQNYVESITRQTVKEYVNLTQNTAFAVFDKSGNVAPLFASNDGKVATSLSDTYIKVIDQAVTAAQMGSSDYQSAMRQTIKSLADSGIRAVDYATGYSRRLDSAVRQNVLWGIKQCNQNTADIVGEQFGADGYEISYHSAPRPSHEEMGGRQYAIDRACRINGEFYPSISEVEGLLNDYGCLHFKFSILLGVSEPAYDKKQLAEFKENDRQVFEFEGKEYTKYEASQVQRKLETEMRHQKDRANIAKAAGDDEARRVAQERINLLSSKYKQFSDASGLPTKAQRMSVSGFRRVKTQAELKPNVVEQGIAGKIKNVTSENKVDLNYIQSKEYKAKFSNMTGSKNVDDAIYNYAKASLTHRSGTYYENLYLIDKNTGKLIASETTSTIENSVTYSTKTLNMIKRSSNSLIAIHNHGTNNPPTGSDLVSAGAKNYSMGVVICHNGDVYTYQAGKKVFTSTIFSKSVDRFAEKGYNIHDSIIQALSAFEKEFGIKWAKH